jgi:glycosyltransferase involved in cell wall biosynthesis
VKILVAADDYPWPARSGYRQRLHWVLRTLSLHGDVDLLVVRDRPLPNPQGPPPDVSLGRAEIVTAPYLTRSGALRTARWLASGRPRRLVGQDWSWARETARQWSRQDYDLVWFGHSPVHFALADHLPTPHVVDLDNLESSMVRHRRTHAGRSTSSGSVARQVASTGADLIDERRWRRLELKIAETATITVVCSELDRRRLSRPGVRVLPNGYELPPGAAAVTALPAAPAAEGPVLLFIGLLTYEPNRDAVAFFAREVFPLVRARRPDARFRVVGDHGGQSVIPAGRSVGVEVTGEVPDVTAELATASVVVVPVRFGGGTRIKVLEAFAHGVPVVSTTVGCEGLDVEDGRHVLLADDPRALAANCLALLEDADRRAMLSSHARDLWKRQYRWSVIAPTVGEIVEAAIAPPGSPR